MRNQTNIKTYSELQKLETFEDRFNYLHMNENVGSATFGFERYLNQKYYKSKEWEEIRNKIILRDQACDLGIMGEDIYSTIIIHHMNPIDSNDIKNQTKYLNDPEYLISTSLNTHNAIHFGNKETLAKNKPATRIKNDHCPWKNNK